MTLELRDDMPTDHITWFGRGYEQDTGHHDGVMPHAGPGACEGMAYSKLFRRKGRSLFGVRGISDFPEDPEELPVYRAATSLGARESSRSGMWDTFRHEVDFLDGGIEYEAPCEGRPFATLDAFGNNAVRLLCHRLGVRPPKLFPDETFIPDNAELEWRLWQELTRNKQG
jgi:hypothetical protein